MLSTPPGPERVGPQGDGRKIGLHLPGHASESGEVHRVLRTFPIAKADVDILVQMLNQAAGPFGADDLRPTFVSLNESRTISVRATPAIMARIAKLIADNDK
jgi:hypothetical protein